MRRGRRQRGFTLLEVLVVLVIIGIVTSMAVLNIGDRSKDLLQQEARRLTALIALAREEAILEGREYGIGFWRGQYQFYELDEEKEVWNPLATDTQLRARQLPDNIELILEIDNQQVLLDPKPPETPQLMLLSSGETTAFRLELELLDSDLEPVVLEYDQLGRPIA